MLELEQGKKLVKLARSTVEKKIKEGKFEIGKTDDKELNEKRGVFVTIQIFPEKTLRGCIGTTSGDLSIYEGVQKVALSSAFEDSRFPPVKKENLDKIIFEVSLLSKPESIQVKDPDEYAKKIEIGKDGLILKNGPFSGLLLPQVPLEFKWNASEFLDNLCFKAGLTSDWLHDENTRLWKFQSQIFAEKSPKGEIVEIKLAEHVK